MPYYLFIKAAADWNGALYRYQRSRYLNLRQSLGEETQLRFIESEDTLNLARGLAEVGNKYGVAVANEIDAHGRRNSFTLSPYANGRLILIP